MSILDTVLIVSHAGQLHIEELNEVVQLHEGVLDHTNSCTIKGPIDPSHVNRAHHCLYAAQGVRRGERTCNDKLDQSCIRLEV